MMTLLALWGKYRGIILGAVAVAAVIAASFVVGCEYGSNDVRVDWQAEQLVQSDKIIARQVIVREIESDWAAESWRIGNELFSESDIVRKDADDTIAAVRNGTLQLRDELRQCNKQRSRMSETTPDTPGDDGAGEGGLPVASQEDLIRLAEDADLTVKKLTACQDYVDSLTKGNRATVR